jgi:hypothetical protein
MPLYLEICKENLKYAGNCESNQQGIIKIKPSTTIEEVSLKKIVI